MKNLTLFFFFVFNLQAETPVQPAFLYKILSYRNWQATQACNVVALSAEDHDFIHFSTEVQLETIVQKYWTDVPQYVVLKIDTQHLPGKLVHETNPEGTTSYYHLYGGYIPRAAVFEAKIIYQRAP